MSDFSFEFEICAELCQCTVCLRYKAFCKEYTPTSPPSSPPSISSPYPQPSLPCPNPLPSTSSPSTLPTKSSSSPIPSTSSPDENCDCKTCVASSKCYTPEMSPTQKKLFKNSNGVRILLPSPPQSPPEPCLPLFKVVHFLKYLSNTIEGNDLQKDQIVKMEKIWKKSYGDRLHKKD